jgi:hypothetical protein
MFRHLITEIVLMVAKEVIPIAIDTLVSWCPHHDWMRQLIILMVPW